MFEIQNNESSVVEINRLGFLRYFVFPDGIVQNFVHHSLQEFLIVFYLTTFKKIEHLMNLKIPTCGKENI